MLLVTSLILNLEKVDIDLSFGGCGESAESSATAVGLLVKV